MERDDPLEKTHFPQDKFKSAIESAYKRLKSLELESLSPIKEGNKGSGSGI